MKRQRHAVGYIRTASVAADGHNSVANQKERIRRMAEDRNLEITKWYEDIGVSGVSKRPPTFDRLCHEIESGDVSLVFVSTLDRLSRNHALARKMYLRLREAGVDVVSAANPEGLISEYINTIAAQLRCCSEFDQPNVRRRADYICKTDPSIGSHSDPDIGAP